MNGSSELASWSVGLKRFAAARQVDCLVCGTNSECLNNHCVCASGYTGDQPLDCFKSKNLNQRPNVLLPIYHEPPETDSYRNCISPTWKRIADVGEKGTAIVDPFLVTGLGNLSFQRQATRQVFYSSEQACFMDSFKTG